MRKWEHAKLEVDRFKKICGRREQRNSRRVAARISLEASKEGSALSLRCALVRPGVS